MKKVAITGNIGSGKSAACKVFETLGIPVFYADQQAKALYGDVRVQQSVREAFGDDIFDMHNKLIKSKLAALIFNDKKALQTINNIIHPRMMQQYANWLEQHANAVYTLHEAAVIFENGLDVYFDKIINVSAPVELRILRIMKRDQLTRQAVENRMAMQWPDEKKNEKADFVIVSNNKRFLIPQVLKIHNSLIK